MTEIFHFKDHAIPYDVLLEDLANRVAEKLAVIQQQPEYVSQRQAYRMFGRGNVDRWLRNGELHPCKRPGKVEYRTSELRMQQMKQQDYFIR